MEIYSSIINSLLFLLIALLHAYWAFGGMWASRLALPTKQNGETLFLPSKMATLTVALVLILFSLVTLSNVLTIPIPYLEVINWLITGIFFIRFIGDFKFVGITKKIKETPFALYDTRYYSPLCLYISINSLILSIT